MKRVALALALIASPLAALAECAAGHQQQAMSCAENTMWDAEAQACVPLASS